MASIPMKDCPSCDIEVPTVAKRCKACFHDFQAQGKSGASWAGPLALLVAFAAMVAVANLTLLWIVTRPQEQRVQVDQDAQTIVWTETYVTGTTTSSMRFDDIAKVEYVQYGGGTYEIAAVGTTGNRRIIQSSDRALQGEAKTYARVMDRELVVIDHTRGFDAK